METSLDTRGIAGRVLSIRERINRAARESNRNPGAVTLIAVTKMVDATAAREAVQAGVVDLGENRVQELAMKADSMDDLPQIQWHLIGRLQRNKVAKAVEHAGSIHGIDSLDLAGHVGRVITRLGRGSIDVFAQINVSGEQSKAGFDESSFMSIAPRLATLPGLRWRGLMTIAPEHAQPRTLHQLFADLRMLHRRAASTFDAECWNALSMGMTDDFEIAIAEGATHVRVGRAIFGDRSIAIDDGVRQ